MQTNTVTITCRQCGTWQVEIDELGTIIATNTGMIVDVPNPTPDTPPLVAEGARPEVAVHQAGPWQIGPPAWFDHGERTTSDLRTITADTGHGFIMCTCEAISVIHKT